MKSLTAGAFYTGIRWFTLQILIDAKQCLFRLTAPEGSIVETKLKLSDLVETPGPDVLIEFDSLLNKDPNQPVHVSLLLSTTDKKRSVGTAHWIVTDSRQNIADAEADQDKVIMNEIAYGSYGILIRVLE